MPNKKYYLWKTEGCPVSIELSLAFVDRLASAVSGASRVAEGESLPRVTEIGGLLLGRRRGADTLIVEAFEEIPSEHRRGASFDLSMKDRLTLQRRLAHFASAGRTSPSVLGYFRSHTRSGMYMDKDENELAKQFFSSESDVFLLVKPHDGGQPTAGFFFWRDGEIDRRQTSLPFPFTSALLLSEGHPIVNDPSLSPAVTSEPLAPALQQKKHPLLVLPQWAVNAGVFLLPLVLIPGFTFLSRTVRPPSTAHKAALGRVHNARPEEALLYDTPDGEFSTPGAAAPEEANPESEMMEGAKTLARVRVRHPPNAAPPQIVRVMTAPPRKHRLLAEVRLPPPPDPMPAAPAHHLLYTVPVVSIEPVKESAFRRTISHIIGKRKHGFVPARVLTKRVPAVSQEIASSVKTGDVPVELKIRIDKDGDVEETELLSKNANPAFAKLAVSAASNWNFEPAKVNDQPISSEMLVQFRLQSTN